MNWHEYFDYNAETGELVWSTRPDRHFARPDRARAWRATYAGTIAGSISSRNGYTCRKVGIGGKLYWVSRICFEMANHPIPPGLHVDHINGNPMDNRAQNLRLATRSQNMHNRKCSSLSKTGVKGVSKLGGTFQARITSDGVRRFLGSFPTIELAQSAYNEAANRLHGKYARITHPQ